MHPKTLALVSSNSDSSPISVRYEQFVCDALAAELESTFGKAIPVLHDKKYTGKSGHRHQIDLSARIRIAGLDLLILIECKFYSRSVAVDEVLEFSSRIEDLSAHKGAIVTTTGFQDGARKLAASKGISLILLNHEYPKWGVAGAVVGGAAGFAVGGAIGFLISPIGVVIGGAVGAYGALGFSKHRKEMALAEVIQTLRQDLKCVLESPALQQSRRGSIGAEEMKI